MRSSIQYLLALLMLATLPACGATQNNESSVGGNVQSSAQVSEGTRLREDYDDALSIRSQLAAGTILLEETDLAVDEILAAELLPLWRAAQSLTTSDTAAEVEIEAVYNQIQDTMTPEQIAAIADMNLTQNSLTTLFEEGRLFSDLGGFGAARGDGSGEGFRVPEGGLPGGRGSDFPGDGPGGGPGGGIPEGMNPEVMATRMAQFTEEGSGSFQERALISATVRLLEMKTGEASEDRPMRPFELAFDVVAEATGLTVDEIRVQTAEGRTLAQIVEENGGDIEQVRLDLIQALSELPNAQDLDLEQLASDWLGLDE